MAGPQDQAKQLALLAGLAAAQMDAPAFIVRSQNKFTGEVRGRLNQIEGVVTQALADLELTDSDTTVVQQRTWEVLSRLTVLMPRLEPPDETDWTTLGNSLIPVAAEG